MKIAIVRSDWNLTVDQEAQARQRVAKQLPSDWTVIYLPSRMSAEFLETVPNSDPDVLTVKCSPQTVEKYIGKDCIVTTTASMVGCAVSGRLGGAPPKITRDGIEIGESIVAYREWLTRTPGAQCDHEFIGERIPGGMLSCVYCRKPMYLPEEVERG